MRRRLELFEPCGDCDSPEDCVADGECYLAEAEPEQCPECGYEMPCGCPRFADPGGNSALRAQGPGNPRNLPCPTCGEPDRLTPADAELAYQCDSCADRAERGGY